MKSLIKKYDRPGPRYTSYPPVPFWKNPPTEDQWFNEINLSLASDPRIDLYLHIPFCEQLCYYCGCHRTITKDKSRGEGYADLLLEEWALYRKKFRSDFQINSLHFGGGTPTFLAPEILQKILNVFQPHFSENFIGAMEVDPRTCTRDHLSVLRNAGFRRLSLGIQDFDDEVQTRINRKQSFKMVKSLVDDIRLLGFEAMNFDLIYGLPGQTEESILATMNLVGELRPDTIAFYSYAHLPDRITNQRLIKDADLPSAEKKLDLYLKGQEKLSSIGYRHIGMDHFAKEGSFLAGSITRNFMGYTDKKSSLLIGLGASSIGQAPGHFVQNEKDLKIYETLLKSHRLPIVHGHSLTIEEKEISHFLQDLFCQGEVTFPPHLGEKFEDEDILIELERDGLIVWKNHKNLIVTPLGKRFLRNIAMAIDPLLKASSPVQFSRTI